MDQLLVKVEEAAELLRVGRSTVYVLMQTGELPSVRVKGSRRIPMAALASYVEALDSENWTAGLKRGA